MEIDIKAQDAAWEEHDRLLREEDMCLRRVAIEAQFTVLRYPQIAELKALASAVRLYLESRDKSSNYMRETLMPMTEAARAFLETCDAG